MLQHRIYTVHSTKHAWARHTSQASCAELSEENPAFCVASSIETLCKILDPPLLCSFSNHCQRQNWTNKVLTSTCHLEDFVTLPWTLKAELVANQPKICYESKLSTHSMYKTILCDQLSLSKSKVTISPQNCTVPSKSTIFQCRCRLVWMPDPQHWEALDSVITKNGNWRLNSCWPWFVNLR